MSNKEWDTDYKEIPMGEITDEARELAVRWAACEDPSWIGNKVKLASDIMNYARRVKEGKVDNTPWITKLNNE